MPTTRLVHSTLDVRVLNWLFWNHCLFPFCEKMADVAANFTSSRNQAKTKEEKFLFQVSFHRDKNLIYQVLSHQSSPQISLTRCQFKRFIKVVVFSLLRYGKHRCQILSPQVTDFRANTRAYIFEPECMGLSLPLTKTCVLTILGEPHGSKGWLGQGNIWAFLGSLTKIPCTYYHNTSPVTPNH